MTDFTFAQLEAVVEQVLRPVWASRKRKQMLREELLAHVMDVFAEEFADVGNEQIALDKTLHRFGEAAAVGRELQAALGFLDRWYHLFLKENLMSRWLWVVAVVAIFVGPALIMPAVALFNHEGILQVFPLIVGVLITLTGLGMAGYGIKQRIART